MAYTKEHALVFNSKKSVVITFGNKRHVSVVDPEFLLDGVRLDCRQCNTHQCITHPGVVLDEYYGDNSGWERLSTEVML